MFIVGIGHFNVKNINVIAQGGVMSGTEYCLDRFDSNVRYNCYCTSYVALRVFVILRDVGHPRSF